MKRKYTGYYVILGCAALMFVLCCCGLAFAAKLRVTWTAPTQNVDGSALTDLTGYRVEWGSCNADGSFGTYQAGINVTAPATSTWIYPTGLSPVCARVYSIATGNVLSAPAYASGPAPVKLSQPMQK